MDRGREALRGLAAGLLLALAACASEPDATPPLTSDSLRALRWLAEGADRVSALTTQPVACRDSREPFSMIGGSSDVFDTTEVGRIAFESPALLGGAAARMGISCSSCHVNGRGNQDFFVAGVSGAPGTADVTSSLFSKVRGNGAFDPMPIPDISARDGKQIRDRLGPEFRAKVHGLIVEEFDGQEPGERILSAVIDYMAGLTPCPDPDAREPITPDIDLGAARTAFAIAQASDGADRRLMVRAARERLERVHERFPAGDQMDVREALLAASEALSAWLDGADPARARQALDAAAVRAKAEASASLYAPDVLRAALDQITQAR